MRWPWSPRLKRTRPSYTPDPEAAARGLARARARRPAVDRLVADLLREHTMNGFTASVTVILRGEHR